MASAKILAALAVGAVLLGSAGSAAAYEGYYDRGRVYAPPSRVVIVKPGRTIIAPYPPAYQVVYERPRWHHRPHYVQVIDRPYHYGYAPYARAWGYERGRW